MIHFIASLICILSVTAYASPETATYGELMIQDAEEFHLRSVSAGFGYDVTNPYLNTFNGSMNLRWGWTRYWSLGLSGFAFQADKSKYNQSLEQDLGVFGIEANDVRPRSAALAFFELAVLSGRVNLLGQATLPMKLLARLGSGWIWLDHGRRRDTLTWGFGPELFLSKRWSLQLNFDQDLESFWTKRKNIYRNRLGLSFGVHF